MSIANPEAETLTMKQRICIGVLGVLSVLLAALVVFYFSPAEETGAALTGRNLFAGSVRAWVRPSCHSDRFSTKDF